MDEIGESDMSRKWYGNLNNRVDENRMFCKEITVGTGMTEYSWSDRHAWEVVEVVDQKHITVRQYDVKKADDIPYSNHWNLISNENNPTMKLVRRGKYWYAVATCTVELAKQILEGKDNIDDRIWACNNGFDLKEIVEQGKTKYKYHRKNVSFGVADYYFDYEF